MSIAERTINNAGMSRRIQAGVDRRSSKWNDPATVSLGRSMLLTSTKAPLLSDFDRSGLPDYDYLDLTGVGEVSSIFATMSLARVAADMSSTFSGSTRTRTSRPA